MNPRMLRDLYVVITKSKSMMKYLKMFNSKSTLIINGKSLTAEDIAYNIEEKSKEKDYKNILIMIDNRTYDNIDLLRQYSNVNVQYDDKYPLSFCSIDEFKMMRDKIDSYKSSVLEKNLSPLEQITFIYDIVKSYRYNESEEDAFQSRAIHSVFSTGNIVCSGYVLLMEQIFTELGYECYGMTLRFNGETTTHSQFMIRIKDEKYGVDGYYVFDPTADSAKRIVFCIGEAGKERIKNESEIEPKDKILYDYGENASYRAFLIPLKQYKSLFMDASIVDIKDMEHNDVTSNFISVIDECEDFKGLDLNLFFNLMYRVRCAQGFSSEDSIKSACDLVSVNFVLPNDQDSINAVISNIDNSLLVEGKVYTKKQFK